MQRFGRNNRITEVADCFYGAVIGAVAVAAYSPSAGMVGGGDAGLKRAATNGTCISFLAFFRAGGFGCNLISVGVSVVVIGVFFLAVLAACIAGSGQHGDCLFLQGSATERTGLLAQTGLGGGG